MTLQACSVDTLPGDGTLLQVQLNGTGTFTTVGKVTEVDGPSLVVEAVEATSLESTIHTYRPSRIPNPEKLSFKCFYNPKDPTHQAIIADASVPGLCRNWKLIFVDNYTVRANSTWTGFVTSWKLTDIKIDENVGADVELQPTTIPIFNPGSGATTTTTTTTTTPAP